MRYVVVALMLLAVLGAFGCKKHSRPAGMPPLDLTTKPECAALMPDPLARWSKPEINIYFDFPQVYARDGLTVPAHVLPLASHGIRNQVEAWRAKHGDLLPAIRLVETQAEADVVIFIYYEPYKTSKSGSVELAETDVFPLSPDEAKTKMASGIGHELPPQDSNYNAFVSPVIKRGVIYAAACGFNGAATDYYATTANPQDNADQFYFAVGNHETGHWQLGFNDDIYGTFKSLMCYHNMTAEPTPCDLEVSRWCTAWQTKAASDTDSPAKPKERGINCNQED
jgi:hypothetical protein